MRIYNLLNGTLFYDATPILMPHHSSYTITKKTTNGRIKVTVLWNHLDGTEPTQITFWFDKLTMTVQPNNYDDFVVRLSRFNLGYDTTQTLMATESQTVFQFTKPFSGTDMKVTVDGSEVFNYEVTGYGEITLDSGFTGGELINVLNFE